MNIIVEETMMYIQELKITVFIQNGHFVKVLTVILMILMHIAYSSVHCPIYMNL